MTPTDFLRRLRSPSIGLLRGFRPALLVVALAWLAAPTSALAQTDYALSNTTAVLDGQQYSVTGLFSVFDSQQFFAQFQLTGSGPVAGTYLCSGSGPFPIPGTCPFPQTITPGLVSAGGLQIGFNGSAITSVGFPGLPARFTDNAPTGVPVIVGGRIDYSFSQDAATVIDGTRYSITGDFGFDPLTGYELGAEINFVGPPPFGGTAFFDAEPAVALNIFTTDMPSSPLRFPNFIYANDLSNVPDPLQEISGDVGTFPATGFACPGTCPSSVPEPGSLALQGTALGLFLLGFQAIRRASQPHPDRAEGA